MGDKFWTGRGFGRNLAFEDGFAAQAIDAVPAIQRAVRIART